MNKISPDSGIDKLENLSILDLSKEDVNILLEGNVELKSFLNAAQETNQLRTLLRHLILKSLQPKDDIINSQEELLEWRLQHWKDRIQEAFLDRRRDLDQVSFWMLQTIKQGQANEIYYQLCNEEVSFEKLASIYRGVRKEIKKPYDELHKVLQLQLRGAGTSKPQVPIKIKSGYLVTKVIEQHPAELNVAMKQTLLQELENEWADRQIMLRLEELRRSKSIYSETSNFS